MVFVYKWSYKTGFTVCIQYNYWMCLAQVLSFAERLVVYKPLYKGHYFRSLFPSAFPIHIHMHAVHAHAVHAHAEPLVTNSPNSKNLSITNCLNLRVQTDCNMHRLTSEEYNQNTVQYILNRQRRVSVCMSVLYIHDH